MNIKDRLANDSVNRRGVFKLAADTPPPVTAVSTAKQTGPSIPPAVLNALTDVVTKLCAQVRAQRATKVRDFDAKDGFDVSTMQKQRDEDQEEASLTDPRVVSALDAKYKLQSPQGFNPNGGCY